MNILEGLRGPKKKILIRPSFSNDLDNSLEVLNDIETP